MSSVKLTGNFLATARCLIFADSSTGVWSFNPNTNTLTINAAGGLTGLANPTAKVELTAVNGSAATAMRSDGAPALDVSITPTWTGAHTFSALLTANLGLNVSGAPLSITVAGSVVGFVIQDGNGIGWYQGNNNALNFNYGYNADSAGYINFVGYNNGTTRFRDLHIANGKGADIAVFTGSTKAVTLTATLGINGNVAPAQVTGWGTPTGGAVVSSFAAGASPSLLQMSEAVAQIISDLKAFGIYGA
jgi:hypothetical protein